ncbi:hypothetical protein AC578_8130 [Pseudocercospora eumusae]|uniref:Uncharacterized protein n=1 Tax=Pseudocercospora eumusae TaxID=321146 RepID=A0A139HAF8_9PEZI|nr:hypothetical protein AC578_8130 [Pseudocercospora eumusae]
MKFTLFATAAFVAGTIAAPTSPSSYGGDACDGLKKAYTECKAIQDKDYDQWQAAIKYEALQKSQYETCKALEAKYEADYKSCGKADADAKKQAYDAAKYEAKVIVCKTEGQEWKAAWEKNAAAEKELHKQEGICNYKKWQFEDCEKKEAEKDKVLTGYAKPAGYSKPAGY